MALFGVLALGIAACTSASPARQTKRSIGPDVPATVTSSAFQPPAACNDAFVKYKLPFATGTRLREIGTYVSNGAGVAVNDLDGDGDLDLVFASVDGQNTILWNQGQEKDGLRFNEEDLDDRFGRGAVTVASAARPPGPSAHASKQERRSPRFTTRLDEIAVARA